MLLAQLQNHKTTKGKSRQPKKNTRNHTLFLRSYDVSVSDGMIITMTWRDYFFGRIGMMVLVKEGGGCFFFVFFWGGGWGGGGWGMCHTAYIKHGNRMIIFTKRSHI